MLKKMVNSYLSLLFLLNSEELDHVSDMICSFFFVALLWIYNEGCVWWCIIWLCIQLLLRWKWWFQSSNMNDGRQMEVHYIDTGFPYTVTQSFMDFFEGLTHVPLNYAPPAGGSMLDQVLFGLLVIFCCCQFSTCLFPFIFKKKKWKFHIRWCWVALLGVNIVSFGLARKFWIPWIGMCVVVVAGIYSFLLPQTETCIYDLWVMLPPKYGIKSRYVHSILYYCCCCYCFLTVQSSVIGDSECKTQDLGRSFFSSLFLNGNRIMLQWE